jgi:predicted nucleotidyltransferase
MMRNTWARERQQGSWKYMNPGEDKNLEIFLEKLREEFGRHLQKVILFGSRARGDHSEESDYDCLLILDEVTPEVKEILNAIEGEMLYEYGAVFSAFPLTLEDLERKRFEPFIMNVRKEGVML